MGYYIAEVVRQLVYSSVVTGSRVLLDRISRQYSCLAAAAADK